MNIDQIVITNNIWMIDLCEIIISIDVTCLIMHKSGTMGL